MDKISTELGIQQGSTIQKHLLIIPAGWTDNRWEYVGKVFNKLHEHIVALEKRITELESRNIL